MGAGDLSYNNSKRRVSKLEVEENIQVPLLGDDGGGGHGSSGGSVWGSVFNLCNSAIGAGILALPYAIQQSGLILGMIAMVAMCFTLAFTLKILVWANRLHPDSKSYEKLVWAIFGKRASIFVTFSVILTTFGACTGFLVIIADLLPPIVKLIVNDESWDWVYSRAAVAIAVSVVGILPLASLKHFNSLRFSSTLAIVSVSFTVFVIVLRSAQTFPLTDEVKDSIRLFHFGVGIFDALPLISFAFGCHMQIVPIFAELKDNHIPYRTNSVIICTNLVCVVLYSLTGVFGYVNFPTSDQSNVLKNYADDDVLVNVARAILCFVIVCHYPPSNYCCRAALDYLIFPTHKPNTVRRLMWTFVVWGLALFVSLVIPEISVVFGLIGATANSLIVFIFPALLLLKCHGLYDWEGVRGFSANLLGITILVIGVIISIVGTVIIVLQQWFPSALEKIE